MGYIRHDAIIVTAWNDKKFQAVLDKAEALFPGGAVAATAVVCNGYRTLLIAPDGSKEGWEESVTGDACRDTFTAWLKDYDTDESGERMGYLEWVEIRYGNEFCDGGPEGVPSRPPQVTRWESQGDEK